jgi:hypothetical protein
MTDVLQAVTELLYGPGEPLYGFDGDEAQAEAEAILNFTGKPYCLIRDWIIVEVEVDDNYRDELAAAGFEPNVVYASNVRIHSAGKRRQGDWVRSTFQRSFTLGYFFETKNTVYLLMGVGFRKKASAQTVLSIVE